MSFTVLHDHLPVYRVCRRGWVNPLDTITSQSATANHRWNTPAFPALYCCCSVKVARAIVRDVFGLAAIDVDDLQEDFLPQLVEVHWTGTAVDMASEAAIASAGFTPAYPNDAGRAETQAAACEWHRRGAEAVVCRSASLARSGYDRWEGDHQAWSELAVFVGNAVVRPSTLARRMDLDWLTLADESVRS